MRAITGGRLIVPDGRGEFRVLFGHAILYGEKIAEILSEEELSGALGESLETVIDAAGDYVAPGFVNAHIHGAGGWDTMDDDSRALSVIAAHQAASGVTSFLPTTMTCAMEDIRKALGHIREALGNRAGARVLGAHMEGPFISPAYCGAQNPEHILRADFSLIAPYLDVLKLITVAPEELPAGSRFLGECGEHGVVVSFGHSAAGYEETIRGFREAGTGRVTHLFNGMAPFHHRNPGLLGAALETDAYCELIADNIHSHPAAHRMLWRVKQGKRIVLITDSIRAAGLGDGESELGGQRVFVRDGKATLADGTLAGSVLTMDRALRNFADNTGCGIPAAAACASKAPAESLGLYGEIGSLEPGKRADIVIFDDEVRVKKTVVDGETVFAAGGEGEKQG